VTNWNGGLSGGESTGSRPEDSPMAADHLEEDDDRHPWVNHLVGKDRYIEIYIGSYRGIPSPYRYVS